jgi:hypothetical protein
MSFATRPVLAAVLFGAVLAGCGSQVESSPPAPARLVGATGTTPGQIILSQLGKDRIGLQTAAAQSVPAAPPIVKTRVVAGVKHTTSTPAPPPADKVIVPYSALVYDPSGKVYVFTQRSPLTFVEVPATVDRISGNSAYLTVGPKPGVKVVTVGAEELYGVQTGVLDQT